MQKILKLLIGLLALILIVLLMYGIFLKDKLDKEDSTDTNIVKLDTITTSLQGGTYHFLKVDLSLHSQTQSSELRAYMPQVRRTVLNLAMKQNGEVLLRNDGKKAFKQQIKTAILKQYGIQVQDVYFNNFVMAD